MPSFPNNIAPPIVACAQDFSDCGGTFPITHELDNIFDKRKAQVLLT
jgi:hypothetical protein